MKCEEVKLITNFNFKDKKENKRNNRCKLCTRADVSASYYKNREHYLAYRSRRNKMLYQVSRRHVYTYLKKHPCVDCGLMDPRVLQFDHVRGIKLMEVGLMMRRHHSLKQIENEIKKCDVRCANCHSVKTAIERRYYADME